MVVYRRVREGSLVLELAGWDARMWWVGGCEAEDVADMNGTLLYSSSSSSLPGKRGAVGAAVEPAPPAVEYVTVLHSISLEICRLCIISVLFHNSKEVET